MGSLPSPLLNAAGAAAGAIGVANALGVQQSGWPLILSRFNPQGYKKGPIVNDPKYGTAIVFNDYHFEIPETIDMFGGPQTVAIHEFPTAPSSSGGNGAGIRTVQVLGAFPRTLRWRGQIIQPNAAARFYEIDRWRISGDTVYLSWGEFAWSGVLSKWLGRPRGQYRFEYHAEFEPEEDLASKSLANQATDPPGLVNRMLSGIAKDIGFSATTAQSVAQDFIAVAGTAVASAGGLLSGIDAPTKARLATQVRQIQSAATAAKAAAKANPTAGNFTAALFSSDLANQATAAGAILTGAPRPVTLVTEINPNLPALAMRYYGDASKWTIIAQANGLTDPQPTGQYKLTIPTET